MMISIRLSLGLRHRPQPSDKKSHYHNVELVTEDAQGDRE